MSQLNDDPALRPASFLLIVGAALLMAGNAVHPVDSEPSATSRFEFAGEALWVPVHLALGLGFLAVAIGMVNLFRSIEARRTGGLSAQIGSGSALLGGTLLAAVFVGLDGYAVGSLANEWATADTAARAGLESAAVALEAIDSGLAALGTLALLGIALTAVGLVVLVSRLLPSWLGWTGVVLGVAGTVTGVLLLTQGFTEFTLNVLLRPLGLISTVYFIALGLVARRSDGTMAPSPASPAPS